MLEGLRSIHGGVETLPSVRMFHSSPSRYLWEDQEGIVHTIDHGEGGEQGDPLMPLLFSLGQHGALEAVQRSLRDGERMLACLHDINFVTSPDRVGVVMRASRNSCSATHASVCTVAIRKCGMGLESGQLLVTCLSRLPEKTPCAVVWKGSELPVESQGIKVLGTPLGHPEFVATHLEHIAGEHKVLLERIPAVSGCAVSVADLVPLRSCTGELFIACGAACTGQKVRREP